MYVQSDGRECAESARMSMVYLHTAGRNSPSCGVLRSADSMDGQTRGTRGLCTRGGRREEAGRRKEVCESCRKSCVGARRGRAGESKERG